MIHNKWLRLLHVFCFRETQGVSSIRGTRKRPLTKKIIIHFKLYKEINMILDKKSKSHIAEKVLSIYIFINTRLFMCLKVFLRFHHHFPLQILSSADAISIAKLRTNNCNVIPTNKFKYSHAQDPDLTCPLCQSNEIADESHYIFKCHHFNRSRPVFITPQTDSPSLVSLLRDNQDSTGFLTRLAKFVRKVEFALKNVKPQV